MEEQKHWYLTAPDGDKYHIWPVEIIFALNVLALTGTALIAWNMGRKKERSKGGSK